MKAFSRNALLARVAMAAVLAAALVSPAYAGFQWTAPAAATNAATAVRAPQAPSAPVSPVVSEALPASEADIVSGNVIPTTPDGPAIAAPIYGQGMTDDPITWNALHNARDTARAPQANAPMNVIPQPNVTNIPNTMMKAPVVAAPLAAPVSAPQMSSSQTGGFQAVEGFGSDLPLVMAIRQIVPSQYGFVFDDGIDLATHVSWTGGQSWDAVLQQTLAPLGLSARIQGNVVSVVRNNGGMATPTQSSQMAPVTGPIVMSDTVSSTTQMPMTAMPVSMVVMPPEPVATPLTNDMVSNGAAYTPAAASASALASSATWTAPRNSTLRSILEDWTSRVGVELYWSSEFDYPIQSGVSIQGTFEDAVQTLLKGLSESKPRPLARLHPNLPDGPAVLVVETRQSTM